MTILDRFYNEGIMVIMTVDDGINDLSRVEHVVNFYKNHPALLMWMLGSEWNLNLYFGVASSVQDAAQRTERAAALIKTLDTHHPVATSYGEIDINANGLRLADTQTYVNTICPSVDTWGLNIYRGKTFGTLFDQWSSITTKPLFLGEFGTDAFSVTALTSPPQAPSTKRPRRAGCCRYGMISLGTSLPMTLRRWHWEGQCLSGMMNGGRSPRLARKSQGDLSCGMGIPMALPMKSILVLSRLIGSRVSSIADSRQHLRPHTTPPPSLTSPRCPSSW